MLPAKLNLFVRIKHKGKKKILSELNIKERKGGHLQIGAHLGLSQLHRQVESNSRRGGKCTATL